MRLVGAVLMVAAGAWVMGAASGAEKVGEEKGFVVHEWGVAIRRATAGGTVLTPPAELISGLPAFVAREKTLSKMQPQGWDKPVLWFYGSEQAKVKISVGAEQGFVTASYPKGKLVTRKYSHVDRKAMMVSLIEEAAGYEWEGSLTREPARKIPDVAKEHWWNTAREAGGLYFNALSGERFLFYEATALQEPPVSGKIGEDGVTVRNVHPTAAGMVLIVANVDGKHFVRTVDAVPAGGEVKVGRAELLKEAVGEEKVVEACAAQWRHYGMTAAESAAIAKIWREDVLKAGRILLISRMPRVLYDQMFPLKIEPEPRELVRVGLVLEPLDGQAGAAAWLPGKREALVAAGKAVKRLASSEFEERQEAAEELAKLGESARGVLEEALSSPDADVPLHAAELLKKLSQDVVLPAREGTTDGGAAVRRIRN